MLARRHLNGPEQHVGPQDFGRLAIDAAEPPGMPKVVKDRKPAFGLSTSISTSVFRYSLIEIPAFVRETCSP